MYKTRFPMELYEMVIDQVDEATLHSTALVCKAWTPRSQYNLFCTVELNWPSHYDRFLELLQTSPHLTSLVKEITISENSLLALLRPPMSIIARLPSLLRPYPFVQPRRLTVHNQVWIPTRYDPSYLLDLSHLASITSLDLFDVTFTTVADFSIVLQALQRLRSLNATHVECRHQLDTRASAAIGGDLRCLTSMHIRSSHPTSAIDWLLQCNRFPALRHFECDYELSTNDVMDQGLGAFWSSSGQTLKTLTLAISKRAVRVPAPFPSQVIGTPPRVQSACDRHSNAHLERHFDLSPCTSLATLWIDCRQEREVAPDWTWLIFALTSLGRTATTSIPLHITLAFQHPSHALATLYMHTAALDCALASTKAAVVRLEFDYRCPPHERDEDEDALIKKFPETRSQGVLEGESICRCAPITHSYSIC